MPCLQNCLEQWVATRHARQRPATCPVCVRAIAVDDLIRLSHILASPNFLRSCSRLTLPLQQETQNSYRPVGISFAASALFG